MDNNKKTFIYGLSDPRTNEIRYIGKADNLELRLKHHIWQRNKKCHRAFWIKSIIDAGYIPDIFVIEEVERDTWQEREEFWISHYRSLGANLTNHTDGGEGSSGHKHSGETKQKISVSRHGIRNSDDSIRRGIQTRLEKYPTLSKEHKSKISKSLKGHPNWSRSFIDNPPMKNPEIRKRVSDALRGRPKSHEAKMKMSLAHKGKPSHKKGIPMSDESRQKMRVSQRKRRDCGNWINPMDDDNVRQRVIEHNRRMSKDPIINAKRSESMKRTIAQKRKNGLL